MYQNLIKLAIVLFLLSMMCERLADFFKHYLSEVNTGVGRWWKRKLKIGNLLLKAPNDSLMEDGRYYRILKINILCGFLIAWSFHADLFSLLSTDNPLDGLGWKDVSFFWEKDFQWNIIDGIAFVAGCFATGFFISFGSKFWHDLLDILLQIKNYRRLLADPETFSQDSIGAIERRAATPPSVTAIAALTRLRSDLGARPNISSMLLKSDEAGYYIETTMLSDDASIGNTYPFISEDGDVQHIRLVKIVSREKAQPQMHTLGDTIANSEFAGNFGTFGCLVKKKGSDEAYILTCYHNVTKPGSKFDFSADKPLTAYIGKPDERISAEVISGIRNYEIDAALIKITSADKQKIVNQLPGLGSLTGVRDLLDLPADRPVAIRMYGATSAQQTGFITGLHGLVKIDYPDGEHALYNLMSVQKDGAAISTRGDSGALIIDADNKLLGILVAGKASCSFAMPVATLFSALSLDLITS